jgi:predicted nuclease of predicted toxin-antitoxin system
MRLLFDYDVSARLIAQLADLFPYATHVALVGLERAPDEQTWQYAQAQGYLIVTKDSDFNGVSVLRGFPPKVIWLRLGNCPTSRITLHRRRHHAAILAFAADSENGLLTLEEGE